MLGSRGRGDPNDMVRNRGEGTYLLNEIQGVVPDSGNSAGRLTEKTSLERFVCKRELPKLKSIYGRRVGG